MQHADLDFQKRYFPLVEQAYIDGKVNGQQIALLQDRMSVRENGFQIYGTQLEGRGNTGLYGLNPFLYPDKVDSLRNIKGLDSFICFKLKYGKGLENNEF